MKLTTADPDKIQFTLTATMHLAEWKALRQQLGGATLAHPASDFISEVNSMIHQAEQSFYPREEPKPAEPQPLSPVYHQWTAENHPPENVWVKKRGSENHEGGLITEWGKEWAYVSTSGGPVSFEDLLFDWVQRDGTPCGNLVQP